MKGRHFERKLEAEGNFTSGRYAPEEKGFVNTSATDTTFSAEMLAVPTV